MAIAHDFEYFRPVSLSEALKIMTRFKRPAILAGGTDLVCNMKEDIKDKKEGTHLHLPDAIIDIKAVKKTELARLKKIEFKSGRLFIGSLVTFSELIESKTINSFFPLIAETARNVASIGIRNRATLVGNICSAVPCMDSGPLLRVYEATVFLKSARGERKLPVVKFFKGPRKTALKKGEIVTGIIIAAPDKKHAGCFIKQKRLRGEDLAQGSVAVIALPKNRWRIAFGSLGPMPIRAGMLEKFLESR
ncbi:MAG: FAD binding domain-containing protein, partial [Oligoflexales bacterium]|nr:FAD binding domain-containing protein [Oligoflexales bacterium]